MAHLVRGLIGAALAYALLLGGLYALMHRPPPKVIRTMAVLPDVTVGFVPFARLWVAAREGPLRPGDAAPDFDLLTTDGTTRVRLSALSGRPVALVFGSYTSPSFRREAPNLARLHLRFKDRATFLGIYLAEAHTSDGWQVYDNEEDGVSRPAHESYEHRMAAAREAIGLLGIDFPVAVDSFDNTVEASYTAWPSRLYLVDASGKIFWKGRPGPYGLRARGLENNLQRLLGQ
jgi:hypothetical protein